MEKFAIIEKYTPSSSFWPNLIKKKIIAELSVEQIVNKYQGFEGELIDLFLIEGSEQRLKSIIDKLAKLKKANNHQILYVKTGKATIPSLLKDQFSWVGYDVGVCEEEKTIYSSIFNEILFGSLKNLIEYRAILNDHFLFSDISIAKEYVILHNDLSALERDVEDYEDLVIYEIWKYKS